MIKLIVGLGNPGQQYEKTRHNAGFLFLDELASGRVCRWSKPSGLQGMVADFNVAGEKVLLLKPQTFMNRSGQVVGQIARYYKFAPEEILIVHDEMDFDVGVVKLKKGGGHAGHNGLKDIISHLASKEFYRLRIGIGRPSNTDGVVDYVLSVPSNSDCQKLNIAIGLGMEYVDQIVAGDVVTVMNKINA